MESVIDTQYRCIQTLPNKKLPPLKKVEYSSHRGNARSWIHIIAKDKSILQENFSHVVQKWGRNFESSNQPGVIERCYIRAVGTLNKQNE